MAEPIENIFHQYYSPLCNYAYKIISDKDYAEDIVQALFIQLYEKNNLKEIENIESYLLRSVRYKCIDFKKKNNPAKHTNINDEAFNLSNYLHEIKEEDIEPLFHYYAAKLPPKTRKVFLLSRVSKLTYKEIAEELNTSQKTVENQMSSALKKLRIVVSKEHFYLLLL